MSEHVFSEEDKDEYLFATCPTCNAKPGEKCRAKGGRVPTFSHMARPTRSETDRTVAANYALINYLENHLLDELEQRKRNNSDEKELLAFREGWRKAITTLHVYNATQFLR